jgi:F-type H+-transporting ATPase subunit epsilon
MSLTIEITTPERTVFQETADSISIPTAEGEITVLPNHLPLVSLLAPGALTLRKGGTESLIAVSTGFVEVRPRNQVLILADTAERAEELDMEKVEEARARAAKNLIEHGHQEDTAFAEAAAALERELARVKVARRHRKI